jgi:katanin p60 ATPase-containing subunit A1
MRKRVAGLTPEQIRLLMESGRELEEQPITADHFDEAFAKNSKSVSANDLKRYEEWMSQYGST